MNTSVSNNLDSILSEMQHLHSKEERSAFLRRLKKFLNGLSENEKAQIKNESWGSIEKLYADIDAAVLRAEAHGFIRAAA